MAELNEAYAVLSSSQQRQAYDQQVIDCLGGLDERFAAWVRAFVRARRYGD